MEPAGNIGFWTNRAEYPEWFVRPAAAGEFDVELTYACAPGHGGDFTVQAGERKLAGAAEPTGGWQNYRTLRLGRMTLPSSRTGVTVRPSGAFRTALMNLKSVRLAPVR